MLRWIRRLAAGAVLSSAAVTLVGAASAGGAATRGFTVVFDQSFASCQLATVDFASGATTPLPAAGSPEACAGDLAFAPDGTLYGLVQGQDQLANTLFAQLVRFDTVTGAATVVGAFGPFAQSIGGLTELITGGLTFDRLGHLYVMLFADVDPGFDPQCNAGGFAACLYRVDDPGNPGATTFLGVSALQSAQKFPGALAASCDAVYTSVFLDTTPPRVVLASVDTANGSLGDLGDFSAYPTGADFDRSGTFWGIVADDLFGLGPPVEHVATVNVSAPTPVDTAGAALTLPVVDAAAVALAVEPLDCAAPPVVAAIRFTG